MDVYKDRILPLFRSAGIPDAELERNIGIKPKKINDWNAGRTKSYEKYIPQIAKYFNVSIDYLLGYSNDPSPPGAEEKPPAQSGELSEKERIVLDKLSRLTPENVEKAREYAEVFEAWKAEHYKEITGAGQASYNRAYDVFEPLHKKKFRDLRTADFQAVLDPYMKQSHSTLSKHKQLITQMSAWAIREELITTNFAKFVKLPENIKKEKEIFSNEDIGKLEADGSETAKIVLMLIYTGMRIGELFSLPLEDYHETYVVGGEKTAAGRNRVIPIRPEGRGYFAYFAAQADGALLLSGYTGQKVPNNFRKRDYYPLLIKLGIEQKTPHAARHTYASRARRAGMPPEILQKILGHADYSTTANIYVHTDIEELVKAVEGGKIC